MHAVIPAYIAVSRHAAASRSIISLGGFFIAGSAHPALELATGARAKALRFQMADERR